jgi:hypothetical protein
MNIDYSDIIAKANKRKEALEKFTNLLMDFNEMNDQLKEANGYMLSVRAALDNIDPEGKALVPDYVRACVQRIGVLTFAGTTTSGINYGANGLGHYLVHGTELKVA